LQTNFENSKKVALGKKKIYNIIFNFRY